jgi:DNA (cytosine-5)-methyltransferase 1
VKVLDLFAGIGGFTLGLERAGFETVAFCEIDPYAQKVLRKNWPEVPIYDDVRTITADRLATDGIGVDVITGGFPCQDISTAGRQAGIEGERSGLWSECARLLGEIRPRYAIFENVTNLLNGDGGDWFKRVLGDISAIGYDAEWHCIPASAIGAHHHRDRIWIIAYPNSDSESGRSLNAGEVQSASLLEDASRIQRVSGREEQGVLREMQEDGAVFNQSCGRGETHMADSKRIRQSGSGKFKQSIFATQDQDGKTTYALSGCPSRIWETEPDVGRVANGVPARSHRLKCLGNAVVPQIPELIGRAIK